MTTRTQPDYVFKYQMSEFCRCSTEQRDAVVAWISGNRAYQQSGRKPTPDEFIKEARRKGSAMYKAGIMETDTRIAARKYWRERAQYFIRHILVQRVNVRTKQTSPPIRAYIPIAFSANGTIPEDHYATAKRVVDDSALRAPVLRRAYGDLLAWLRRYQRYAEVLAEFDEVLAAIEQLKKRAAKMQSFHDDEKETESPAGVSA